jgi:hypothetical protein
MSTTDRKPEERPRTSKAWPRLSQTLPHLHPEKCAACGKWEREEILSLWQECDEQDKPETRYVLLCRPCADQVVEKHCRLYGEISRNAPAPGAMEICSDCRFRDGTWCSRAKSNGGDGVVVTAAQPMTAFMDGTDSKGRRRGWVAKLYSTAPWACSGKEIATQNFKP